MQPMQPIEYDEHGVIRFKENTIVRKLLDEGGINLNDIACWDVSQEDRVQFAQLIGYSVSGFGSLHYVNKDAMETADLIAESMYDGDDKTIDPKDAEIAILKRQLDNVRHHVKEMTTEVFFIHPDDLESKA